MLCLLSSKPSYRLTLESANLPQAAKKPDGSRAQASFLTIFEQGIVASCSRMGLRRWVKIEASLHGI
jgi:hypothetical protein